MGSRRTEVLETYGVIRQQGIFGSFAPNGATTGAANAVQGWVTSVARSDTGLFLITLPEGFPTLIGGYLTAQSTTVGYNQAAGVKLEWGAISATAGTAVIRAMTPGTTTLVDIAANAGNRINFSLIVENSSLTR